MTLQERFDAKYIPEPNSGCWLWDGSVNGNGYGFLWSRGRMERAHRVSYELHVGPIPPGMLVCHKCDIPGCVNPGHLFLGTHTDNAQDKSRKGRCNPACGSSNGALTDAQVASIRAEAAAGEKQRDIASRYGVSHGNIALIISNKSRVVRDDPRVQAVLRELRGEA